MTKPFPKTLLFPAKFDKSKSNFRMVGIFFFLIQNWFNQKAFGSVHHLSIDISYRLTDARQFDRISETQIKEEQLQTIAEGLNE